MPALLQPGPFNSVVGILSRTPRVQSLFFAMIVGATIYNLVAVVLMFWDNLPFYDRYVIQLAPFLGIAAFALLPKLSMPRLLVLVASSALGQYMLWRYVF